MSTDPIIETVVTTRNEDGSVNCAAMGVEWRADDTLVIRPFARTRTLRNLRRLPAAVVHLTDDVLLFCEAALGDPHPPLRDAVAVDGAIIEDACSWREVTVERIDAEGPRATVHVRVVAAGQGREHLGLNRARHAVVEASIFASRLHLLGLDAVEAELERLQPLVDKTGGVRERDAMRYVHDHVRTRGQRGR